MSQYVVKVVGPHANACFYRADGPYESNPFHATRFRALRDAAACAAAALGSRCGVPEPEEIHIIPLPDSSWTAEEILAREG